MNTVSFICLVFAFVLACIAAYRPENPPANPPRFIAAALAFFFLACILSSAVLGKVFGG